MNDDLTREKLTPLLGDRPLRTFPVMVSTEAEALAWARRGGVSGSVVVAGHQIAARGRSGLSWTQLFEQPDTGLGFSLVLRPTLPEEREGWLYLPVVLGVCDVLAGVHPSASVAWPDVVRDGDDVLAAIGVQAEPLAGQVAWAVATVLVARTPPPRSALLNDLLAAIDRRLAQKPALVIDDLRAVCSTLGTRVLAKVLPMGAASPRFLGVARDVHDDGGLTIATDEGARIVVLPQTLGFLGDPGAEPTGPPGIG